MRAITRSSIHRKSVKNLTRIDAQNAGKQIFLLFFSPFLSTSTRVKKKKKKKSKNQEESEKSMAAHVVNLSNLFLLLTVGPFDKNLFRCNDQQNCSIVASTSQFGDPCPNTHKYLEAHYRCVSGK